MLATSVDRTLHYSIFRNFKKFLNFTIPQCTMFNRTVFDGNSNEQ